MRHSHKAEMSRALFNRAQPRGLSLFLICIYWQLHLLLVVLQSCRDRPSSSLLLPPFEDSLKRHLMFVYIYTLLRLLLAVECLWHRFWMEWFWSVSEAALTSPTPCSNPVAGSSPDHLLLQIWLCP